MTTEADDPWNALAAPSTRTSRAFETRDSTQRKRSWVEPTMLPDPTPQDGYVFKWCRTATRHVEDKTNFSKRVREGWEPVDAAEHPELMLELGIDKQTSGKVEVGGLILCKMPEEMVRQRNAYYKRRSDAKLDAADNDYMRENSEVVKKFQEHSRQSVFGRSGR